MTQDALWRESQYDTVKRWLLGGWTCGTVFLAIHIPRYAARVFEMKRELDLKVERRPCQRHSHPRSTQYEWRLVPR